MRVASLTEAEVQERTDNILGKESHTLHEVGAAMVQLDEEIKVADDTADRNNGITEA